MTLVVVNLFGGPCAGKSGVAAGLCERLKARGIAVEQPPEVAKLHVLRGDLRFLKDQLSVFAAQQHYLEMVRDNAVEVAVVDSPLLLSAVYAPKDYYGSFAPLVREVFNSFDNRNFFIERSENYIQVGRIQTQPQAREVDVQTRSLLHEQGVPFESVPVALAVEFILQRLQSQGVLSANKSI